jgi:hypothetical protein
MKKLILAAILTIVATGAQAQNHGTGSSPNSHSVQGHTTSSGTHVQLNQQTNPNGTQHSATGNVNPHTGAVGTQNPRH